MKATEQCFHVVQSTIMMLQKLVLWVPKWSRSECVRFGIFQIEVIEQVFRVVLLFFNYPQKGNLDLFKFNFCTTSLLN